MIVEDFTVRGTERFKVLQGFLKSHASEASFRHSPIHHTHTDCYDVSIRYSLAAALELDKLHTTWKKQDNQVVKMNTNKKNYSFFSLFSFF